MDGFDWLLVLFVSASEQKKDHVRRITAEQTAPNHEQGMHGACFPQPTLEKNTPKHTGAHLGGPATT
jgi:hypothetical protein